MSEVLYNDILGKPGPKTNHHTMLIVLVVLIAVIAIISVIWKILISEPESSPINTTPALSAEQMQRANIAALLRDASTKPVSPEEVNRIAEKLKSTKSVVTNDDRAKIAEVLRNTN